MRISGVLIDIHGALTVSGQPLPGGIGGAAGSPGALAKTGTYLPATHHGASGTPDHVLDSFADLPALLEHLS